MIGLRPRRSDNVPQNIGASLVVKDRLVRYNLDREWRYTRTYSLEDHVHRNGQIDELYTLVEISRHGGNHREIYVGRKGTALYELGEFA